MNADYYTDELFKEDKRKNLSFPSDFENCIFSGCNFTEMDLSKSTFIECIFENVDLSNATITATAFQNCKFSNSKMLGLDWGTIEKFRFHIQAENCNMEHSSFYKTSLKQCALTNCSLKNTDFVDADLSRCNLKGSNLDNAQFQNTNLEKADLRDCMNYSLDPEDNNIKAAKFSLNQLPGLLNKFQIKVYN